MKTVRLTQGSGRGEQSNAQRATAPEMAMTKKASPELRVQPATNGAKTDELASSVLSCPFIPPLSIFEPPLEPPFPDGLAASRKFATTSKNATPNNEKEAFGCDFAPG